VRVGALDGSEKRFARSFKLFNGKKLRSIVLGRLRRQLLKSGAIAPRTSIALALACGKIASPEHRDKLRVLFKKRRWRLYDDEWIKEKLTAAAGTAYEDNAATMVAKLLVRKATRPRHART
jgi:hypothetical protein